MTTRGKKNERGATNVEYGLMVAGIAAAIILPIQAMNLGFDAYQGRAAAEECRQLARAGTPC